MQSTLNLAGDRTTNRKKHLHDSSCNGVKYLVMNKALSPRAARLKTK